MASITILYTSDIHGNLLPLHYADNRPMEAGLSRIATVIKKERSNHPNVLVIDNGDLIQGTPLVYHHARVNSEPVNPMILALNALEIDAAVVGNHEFNYGMELLKKAVGESSFPWLSANLVDKVSGEPFFGKPYLVKTMNNGLRVGILGLTTSYIPNWENPEHIRGLRFDDPVETAKKWVPHLRKEEKVDLVIVSYHGGFERDLVTGEPTEPLTGENQGYQLCQEVSGIDVLLTGHQHRDIPEAFVNGVLVIQPGSQGKFVGKVCVDFDQINGESKVAAKRSELISMDGVPSDESIEAMVKSYEGQTQTWLDQPMGKLSGDMLVKDPMAVRTRDSALIEFINRVQMEEAGVDISNTALFDGSPGFPANITMRDIVSNYIFPNTLKVLAITGQDLKAALERSASYFGEYLDSKLELNPEFTTPKPQHYNYDMWEGIDYVINISRPIGERIVQLTYKGEPIAMDKEYHVVMNNYRAGGGGNYTMFHGKPVVKDIPTDVAELLANYILAKGTITASVDGNWKVVTDSGDLML